MKLLYYENIAFFLGEIALLNIFLVTTLNELIFRSTVLREALVLKSLFQEVGLLSVSLWNTGHDSSRRKYTIFLCVTYKQILSADCKN